MNVDRAIGLLLLGSLLGGCAGQTIKEAILPMPGQPASVLMGRLGFPTEQQTIAGRKVYVWSTSRLVDGSSYACRIRAIVDDRDVIQNVDYEGNEGGCAAFAARLRG